MTPRYDVIVVGARCAGAATAMLLARAGARVLLCDRAAPGTDTLSTHAIMRGGVLQLHRWGLLGDVIAGGAPVISRTTFHYGGEQVVVPIKAKDGIEGLYAPRRTLLDPILVEAARRAGATVRHGEAVRGLLGSGGRVTGVVLGDSELEADLVIGADGVRSTVARLVGAPALRVSPHVTATAYAHWSGVEVDGTHWVFRPGLAAGAIPTDGGLVNVWVGAEPGRAPRTEVEYLGLFAEAAPELMLALGGGRRASKLFMFGGRPGHVRLAHGPGWALVGDAGYFKDPITAHGITDALRDAELLARAILAGDDLSGYQEERDAASLELFAITSRIASLEWDLEELRGLHRRLSAEMSREAAMIAALPASGRLAA